MVVDRAIFFSIGVRNDAMWGFQIYLCIQWTRRIIKYNNKYNKKHVQ